MDWHDTGDGRQLVSEPSVQALVRRATLVSAPL